MGFGNLNIKSTSKFMRVEAGSPRDIRILQDGPVERIVHGFGKEAKPCDGDNCGECEAGGEPSQRFSINVYDHTNKKVLVWEFGAGIAKQLKAIAKSLEEEQRDLMDVDLRVDAEGANKSKKYKITPRMTSKDVPEGLKLYSLEGEIPF